jgi:hypothetical protein
MKRTQLLIFTIVLLLFTSCKKDPHINIGFDSDIDKNSSGMVIAHVSQLIERIYLTGKFSLLEGEVTINLINPDGVTVYSKTIIAPLDVQINEMFEAKKGNWKLKYQSYDGIGAIDLHIR